MVGVTLLGTGAMYPSPSRALSSVLVSLAGSSVLFDCGEGTQAAAAKAGASLMKVRLIALSHYHGDHIFGIPGLLQTMSSLGRTEPVYITGPEGLSGFTEMLPKLTGNLAFEIRQIRICGNGLSLASLCGKWPEEAVLRSFETKHRVSSCGYSFELGRRGEFFPAKAEALGIPKDLWKPLQQGRPVFCGTKRFAPEDVTGPQRQGIKVVISGDTSLCESLVTNAKGADLLICDATYGDEGQAHLAELHGHMTFSQAARCACEAGAGSLWLTHFSHMLKDPDLYLENASNVFSKAVCGKDGMKTELTYR